MKTNPTSAKSEVKRYPEVGSCIYCGSDGGPHGLTDEHIIPYALLGDFILPKSSCVACASVTSVFERFVARDMYGSFRIREGLRTRRPKQRPNTVSVNGSFGSAKIPEAEGIAQFPIVVMPPPGMLCVPPRKNGTFEGTVLSFKTDAPRATEYWKSLPSGDVSFSPSSIRVITFAQMCAKIGHAYAIAEFGIDAFSPLLRSEILSPSESLARFVGGSSQPTGPANVANALVWHAYQTTEGNLLGVDVHLFPGMGQLPVATVVGSLSAGQFKSLQNRQT